MCTEILFFYRGGQVWVVATRVVVSLTFLYRVRLYYIFVYRVSVKTNVVKGLLDLNWLVYLRTFCLFFIRVAAGRVVGWLLFPFKLVFVFRSYLKTAIFGVIFLVGLYSMWRLRLIRGGVSYLRKKRYRAKLRMFFLTKIKELKRKQIISVRGGFH